MNATYPMVAELVRRGEQVIYYATEPFRASVEEAGAEFASYGDADRFVPPAHSGGLHSVMAWEMSLAEHLLPQLIIEVREAGPDYLLIDSMCVWGNLLQQVLKLPAVSMASVFVPNPAHVTVDAMIQMVYGSAPKPVLLAGIEAMNTYIETSRRVDERFGTVSPDIVEFFSNRQSLNLIFATREFHPGGETFDAAYRFVGPMLDPHRMNLSADDVAQFAGDLSLVYVSLGTIFNDRLEFYRTCLTAFAGAPFRVLISTGSKVDRLALGPPSENILLREHVPQLEVLKLANLFITHGGMNSVSEALAFGVPLLVFPQHGDQHLVAARVAELGAGLPLGGSDLSAQKLRAMTEMLLREPRFAASASAIAAQSARSGGALAAADALMEFATSVSCEEVSGKA
jgi:MGT family glycosyltransferase